jgi:putative tryptophan/tyrosine transport system substrate-binding protein
MRRREFIAGLGGAVVWPLAARAQQPALPVVGFLSPGSLETRREFVAAFHRGLAETGYVEGRNVAIEYRWAEDRNDRLSALAADLVRRQVAVIVAGGGGQTAPAAKAAKAATSTIPIIFIGGGTPIESGLVASFNRPGGNVTGVIFDVGFLIAKRMELLHELVPGTNTIALLVRPTDQGGSGYAEEDIIAARTAATAIGLELHLLTAGSEGELDAAFATLAQQRIGALLLGTELFFADRRDQVAALALRYRIPTSNYRRDMVDAGGLMSYGASIPDGYRQVGVYAGRILKGEKPADLPVLAPAKFELVINLKAAKALGLDVPPSFYWRADEVIE